MKHTVYCVFCFFLLWNIRGFYDKENNRLDIISIELKCPEQVKDYYDNIRSRISHELNHAYAYWQILKDDFNEINVVPINYHNKLHKWTDKIYNKISTNITNPLNTDAEQICYNLIYTLTRYERNAFLSEIVTYLYDNKSIFKDINNIKNYLNASKQYKVSGNIMSLLHGDDFIDKTDLTKKIQQKIRTYLTGNVLIFFVCIIVSCVFWFLFTYSENIVYEYEVPIKITNLPDKYIITSKVPQKIRVTSSDIGFHQLHLHWKKDKLPALQIDMTYLVDTTQRQYTVNNKMLRKILHDYPYTSTKQRIIETYPKEFTFHYEILHEKVVPIILVDSSDINDNFMLKNQIQLNTEIYKMYNEGISFRNNYSPRNSCSTGNNEMSGMIGLYSIYNTCTANNYKENTYHQAIFNLFNDKGYKTFSAHNYTEHYFEPY